MKNRIKAQRSLLSLTQTELAKIVKVSTMQIQNYETEKQLPSIKIACKLADVLKIPVRKLFIEKGSENRINAELKVIDTIISCSKRKELDTALKMAELYKISYGESLAIDTVIRIKRI